MYIVNKNKSTSIPIICDPVNYGKILYTDKLKSNFSLRNNIFIHISVCHKYIFVETLFEEHNHTVESFNSCLKLEIKKRYGVKIINR